MYFSHSQSKVNESKMKFIIFCVLICGKLCCFEALTMPDSYYTGDASTDSECALQELKSKGKVDMDFPFPMSVESPECRLTLSQLNQIMRADIKHFIEKEIPNDGNCLANELIQREKTLDLILTVSAILAADSFSESEKKTRLIGFRNEMKKDLKEIATQCHTPEDKLVSLYQSAFENNETLIAMESDYCLAKYVSDRNILDLVDVNLNPNDIKIKHLNCSIVMEEEMRKDEEKFRNTITVRDLAAVSCIMNLYKEKGVFDLDFAWIVLGKLGMPSEQKRSERDKINEEFEYLSVSFLNCYKMDTDFKDTPNFKLKFKKSQ